MIEESDRDETKNQAGASPEPDVLMKHVKNDHSKNKQEFSHGGQKLTSLSNKCQEQQKAPTVKERIISFAVGTFPRLALSGLRSGAGRNFGAQCASVMAVDVVSLDHAIESFPVHREHTRSSLFVATSMY